MVSSARSCCNVKHAKCRSCVLWCPLPDHVVMLSMQNVGAMSLAYPLLVTA